MSLEVDGGERFDQAGQISRTHSQPFYRLGIFDHTTVLDAEDNGIVSIPMNEFVCLESSPRTHLLGHKGDSMALGLCRGFPHEDFSGGEFSL